MGDVLPFIAKVRASGDWTAGERARLEALAQQFGESGLGVEVVFGTTEDGDPWCVVKDQNEEVLVHVARIGGRFVVHYAVDDVVAEGADLHLALAEQLAPMDLPAGGDVVVPFSLSGRQAQTIIALIVATAFFYETSAAVVGDAEPADELVLHDDSPPPPPPGDDDPGSEKREVATQAAALGSEPTARARAAALTAADAPEPRPAAGMFETDGSATGAAATPPTLAPVATEAAALRLAQVEARVLHLVRGGEGDDVLVGTAEADHLIGGGGDDTLAGAGAGSGYDLLEGGDGNDRLTLDGHTVAEGGAGADAFVIATPQTLGHADTLLGVILDLRPEQGDTLQTDRGGVVPTPPTLRPPTPPADPGGADATQQPPVTGDSGPGPTTLIPGFGPGRRVEVDLDGDGVIDGYIWVVDVAAGYGAAEAPTVVTGASLSSWDIGV